MSDWTNTGWGDFLLFRGEAFPGSAAARLDAGSAREPYGVYTRRDPPPLLNEFGSRTRYLVRRSYIEQEGEQVLALLVFHNGELNLWTTN